MFEEIRKIAEELGLQITEEEVTTASEILRLMAMAYHLGYEKGRNTY